MSSDISLLEASIGYTFANKDLLYEAITHPSVNRRRPHYKTKKRDYERLEFLGNSVVNLILTDMIFHHFNNCDEGILSVVLSKMANTKGISTVAQQINLGKYMVIDNSIIYNGDVNNPRNLENCLEAIIGAIYLDGGYNAAMQVVKKLWASQIQNSDNLAEKDAKSKLQEVCQKHSISVPKYKVVDQYGDCHAPIFTVSCTVKNGKNILGAEAKGKSKKEGELKAAKKVLLLLCKKLHEKI